MHLKAAVADRALPVPNLDLQLSSPTLESLPGAVILYPSRFGIFPANALACCPARATPVDLVVTGNKKFARNTLLRRWSAEPRRFFRQVRHAVRRVRQG
jgi:hypothetical protein